MGRMGAERGGVPEFSILETLRLEEGRLIRRDGHVSRARASARALGTGWNSEAVGAALDAAEAEHGTGTWRVRLLVSQRGDPAVECAALVHDPRRSWRVVLAAEPVSSTEPFLRHKTTHREIYNRARAARPGVDDVLLWNERGEITESTIANVVAELDGVRVTPPSGCGLLPGVFRATLLATGEIQERVLTKADLTSATRLWLINSLREWIAVELVGQI